MRWGSILFAVFTIAAIGYAAYYYFPKLIFARAIGGGGQAEIIQAMQSSLVDYCSAPDVKKPSFYVYNAADNVDGFRVQGRGDLGCESFCKWSLMSGYSFVEVEQKKIASPYNIVTEPGKYRLSLVDWADADCQQFRDHIEYERSRIPPDLKQKVDGVSTQEAAAALGWPEGRCVRVDTLDDYGARYLVREVETPLKTVEYGKILLNVIEVVDQKTSAILGEIVSYRASAGVPVGSPKVCQPDISENGRPPTRITLVKAVLIPSKN